MMDPIQGPSDQGPDGNSDSWKRQSLGVGRMAEPTCWRKSRSLAQLWVFLGRRHPVFLCSWCHPGQVQWAHGIPWVPELETKGRREWRAGDSSNGSRFVAGRVPDQWRQEIFWAFRHCVISLFIWKEEAMQGALVSITTSWERDPAGACGTLLTHMPVVHVPSSSTPLPPHHTHTGEGSLPCSKRNNRAPEPRCLHFYPPCAARILALLSLLGKLWRANLSFPIYKMRKGKKTSSTYHLRK